LCDVLCIFYQHAAFVVHQSIAAAEDREWRETVELPSHGGLPVAQCADAIALGTVHAPVEGSESFARNAGASANILAQESRGEIVQFLRKPAMTGVPLRFQAEREVIDALLAAAQMVASTKED
jgi:hypothetical protein